MVTNKSAFSGEYHLCLKSAFVTIVDDSMHDTRTNTTNIHFFFFLVCKSVIFIGRIIGLFCGMYRSFRKIMELGSNHNVAVKSYFLSSFSHSIQFMSTFRFTILMKKGLNF